MSRITGIVAGKLAFVTGGGSGIGRATCQILSREGATVISADKCIRVAEETIVSHTPPSVGELDHCFVQVDVDLPHSVDAALQETLRRYKRAPDIVVNSAGIIRDNWLLKMSEMDFDSVINVNLKGTFLVMQAFAKAMIDGKISHGSIVNISSIVAKYGNMGQVNYSASKSGVIAMTKTASKELGKHNIRVNAVLPGMIISAMSANVPDAVKKLIISQTSLRKMGKPEEVAEVITFLCSDKCSHVTGASVEVTGGF